MKLRVVLFVFCVGLYFVPGDAGAESKDNVNYSMDEKLEFGLERILFKLEVMEYKLQKTEDNLQTMNNKLLQMESNLLQIANDINQLQLNQTQIVTASSIEHRASQKQSQGDIFAALQKLEGNIALNLSEFLNRTQTKVCTTPQRLEQSVETSHNYTQQIMSSMTQVNDGKSYNRTEPSLIATTSPAITSTPKSTEQTSVSSCKEVPSKVSGEYLIRVKSDTEPFRVYCEQKGFGGGWIVIQRRYDGSLDFYRGWNEYRDGFGDLEKEFWLGLEKVHQLTKGRRHELIIELKDFNRTYKYARYDSFEIGSENEHYVLKELGTLSGSLGEGMHGNQGMKFSTKDRDNDCSFANCAQDFEGGWWYMDVSLCTYVNLNGRYMKADNIKSMHWYTLNYDQKPLTFSSMMIREVE